MTERIVKKVFRSEQERCEYVEKLIVESMYYNYAIRFLEYSSYYNENQFTVTYTYVD